MHILILVGASTLTIASVSTQSYATVPPEFTSNDAIRASHVPGAGGEWRQQLLVGSQRLQGLVGRNISAFAWRRSATATTLPSGATNIRVSLSIAPHSPLECSSTFASNVGPNPLQVYSGPITFPTSPAEPGPTVAWDPDNTVRIPFTNPFVYTGGTLCIDIVGTPIPGLEPAWWMADAVCEDIHGQTLDLGGGCGTYGGPTHQWSHVAERSLVPGGYAQMSAYGTPYGLAVAAIGQGTPFGMPLNMLGLNAPSGCELHLSSFDVLVPAVFVPDPHPMLVSRGGRADVEIKIPAIPAALGHSLTTQWFDWSQMATSNAVQWTVATAIPTLDMALIEGHPQEPTGNATAHIAHVLRFEYL